MKVSSFNYINFSKEIKKVNETINKVSLNKSFLTQKTIDSLFISQSSNKELNDFNNAVGFVQVTNGALKNIENKLNQIKNLQNLSETITGSKNEAFKTQINKYSQDINTLLESTFNSHPLFIKTKLSGIDLDTSLAKFDVDNLDEFEESLKKAQQSSLNFMKQINDKIENTANNNFDFQPKEVDFSVDDILNSHQIDKLKSNFYSLISNF